MEVGHQAPTTAVVDNQYLFVSGPPEKFNKIDMSWRRLPNPAQQYYGENGDQGHEGDDDFRKVHQNKKNRIKYL